MRDQTGKLLDIFPASQTGITVIIEAVTRVAGASAARPALPVNRTMRKRGMLISDIIEKVNGIAG